MRNQVAVLFGALFLSVQAYASIGMEVTYGELKPRLLLKSKITKNLSYNRYPDYKLTVGGKYAPQLEYTSISAPVVLKAGDLYRLTGIFSRSDISSGVSKDMELEPIKVTDYKTYYFSIIKLDSKLNPIGPELSLAAKSLPSTVLSEFEKIPDNLSKYADLSASRIKSKDTVYNFKEIKLPDGRTVPANSSSTVIELLKTERIAYTFLSKYYFRLRLNKCLHNCDYIFTFQDGVRHFNWAHQVAEENRRIYTIFGRQIEFVN